MEDTEKNKTMFTYRIKVPSGILGGYCLFNYGINPDIHRELPTLFESANGNAYILIHGSEKGYLWSNNNPYNVTELCHLFKPFVSMRGKQALNIICCCAGFVPTYTDPSGFEVRPAFRTSKKIFFGKSSPGNANYGYLEISCEEKLQIRRGLSSDIRFYCEETQEELERRTQSKLLDDD